jgi:putative ABC transport system ATP-binding protein
MEALTQVGLADRVDHRPSELSGGQQQRVAIARALVNSPAILFADEPTGNLDSKTGEEVMNLLHELNDRGQTIVLITHEKEIADQTERTIFIRDGKIESDAIN